MFSHYNWDKWLHALKDNFSNRNLEFYFTGGEPLIIRDCIFLIKGLVELDNVKRIRIDTNLSAIEHFLENVDSEKVRFLTAFHPTQIPLDAYIQKVKMAKETKMVDVVNFVASKENLNLVSISPHKLIKVFEDMELFLNIAKDFHRGLSETWDYAVKLLKSHGMSITAPTFSRYTRLFEYTCMIANVRSLNGVSRLRVNKDWFHINSDKSKPRIKGMKPLEGFDFELIPTSSVLYAIHYMELRDYAFRLELDRDRWFDKPWWGIRVNQENDTFVWEGGNKISFPLLRVCSPEALANREKQCLLQFN